MNTGVCLGNSVRLHVFQNIHLFQRSSLFNYFARYTFSRYTTAAFQIVIDYQLIPEISLYILQEPKSKVEMRGSPDTTERSNAISEHLKIVEVKCEVVDEKVLNVLEFLSKHSICKLQHFLYFLIFLWYVVEKASNETRNS